VTSEPGNVDHRLANSLTIASLIVGDTVGIFGGIAMMHPFSLILGKKCCFKILKTLIFFFIYIFY
jgi:multisubunit Na+/H+ antiporter MnhE subunit